MKKTYYEVGEKVDTMEGTLLLDNPSAKNEGLRWCRFKTLADAKKRLNKAIQQRKNQYTYFRDKDNKIVNKVSYYDEHEITYKIYKYVVEEEIVYKIDNKQESKIKINENGLTREIPL